MPPLFEKVSIGTGIEPVYIYIYLFAIFYLLYANERNKNMQKKNCIKVVNTMVIAILVEL